jgi:ADP-ribosyl-[dinitrogen reductase] hydrolase
MTSNNSKEQLFENIKSAFLGLAIGDALGVPVEFKSRLTLNRNPVTDMMGYGTYDLPEGTWSDDSSLSFCLADALTVDFDLNIISRNFLKWCNENFWTARGSVFDIGIGTSEALMKIANGVTPALAGGCDLYSNGNGSLMRILPLLFLIKEKSIDERFELIKLVSSITHGHIRSTIACFYYLEFARQVQNNKDRFGIYQNLQTEIPAYLNSLGISSTEISIFDRLFNHKIYNLSVDQIKSTGYVVDTLEASIWCFLTSNNYKEAVLKAVNLGEDTDTTACVTGGLAGLLYGHQQIPKSWLKVLARVGDIEELAGRVCEKTYLLSMI